jgi:hypothetical protein
MNTHKPWTTTELKAVDQIRGREKKGSPGWVEKCCISLSRSKEGVRHAAILIADRRDGIHRKDWTPQEDQELLLMASRGMKWHLIGDVLGRTKGSCSKRAYTLMHKCGKK